MSDLLGLAVVVDDRIPEDLVLVVPAGATNISLARGLAADDSGMLVLAIEILTERGIPVERGAILVRDLDRLREQLAAYAANTKKELLS